MDETAWAECVREHRREKDEAFQGHRSPIPEEDRAGFDGLSYFPVDADHRLEAHLDRVDPEPVSIPRTGGDEITYERVGTFHLDLPEGEATLAAYRREADAAELFLPFQDGTSGETTYGGGRYLEVPPVGDGRYRVDFNLAYHPFCVYDDAYTCPLPPPENRLEVPIRAGERLPPEGA